MDCEIRGPLGTKSLPGSPTPGAHSTHSRKQFAVQPPYACDILITCRWPTGVTPNQHMMEHRYINIFEMPTNCTMIEEIERHLHSPSYRIYESTHEAVTVSVHLVPGLACLAQLDLSQPIKQGRLA